MSLSRFRRTRFLLRSRRQVLSGLVAAAALLTAHAAQSEERAYGFGENLVRWKGDFSEMLERRQLRVLVAYNKQMYFLDGADVRGATYEWMEQFREFLDKKHGFKSRKFQILYLPVTRDHLIPALLDGMGDVAAANLTITPERLEQVDFTDPLATGVREVLVTGPSAPDIARMEDLAGHTIYVRESSSYHASLQRFNETLSAAGLEPMKIEPAEEYLEDSDLLEMANAGVLDMVVVDNHKVGAWLGVFENLTVHDDIAFSEDGRIGMAIRKGSPELAAALNEFIAEGKKGTLLGNMMINRYYKDNKWIRNATEGEDLERLRSMVELFREYGDQYDFDPLMLAALGYQESRLDQSVRSHVGAVGVMQMLPSTAADPNVGIPEIDELQHNIHAGTKYLRFVRDRYFNDEGIDPINQTLLAFASYNAGPNKIASLRKEAAEGGLDPNVWFGNVEHIVAKRVGRETVQYVSNIYKYYAAYKLIQDQGLYDKPAE